MGFFRVVPAAFALLMPPTLSHPVTHEQEALRPVAAGPAVAVAVAARTGGRGLAYGGGTTIGDPIVMRLSSNGRRLSRVVDQWRADCSSGMGKFASSTQWASWKTTESMMPTIMDVPTRNSRTTHQG